MAISDPENLLVPPIVVFEVARQMLVKRGANATQTAIAYLSAGQTEPLNIQMAGEVALFAVKHRLPMADAIIFATARRFGAEIWTQVADFQGLPGKRYFTKVS